MTEGWETVRKRGSQQASEPQITIRANGAAYVNAAADRAFFEGCEYITLRIDRRTDRLGFEPVEEDDVDAFSLNRDGGHGGELSTRSALSAFGVNVDSLDRRQVLRLEEGEDVPFAVADVSPLLDAAAEGEDGESDADTSDQSDQDSGPVDDAESVSAETVRDVAGAVDSVQGLADLLEVSVSKARFEARQAGVYSDLEDRVQRPGVDR